MLLTIVITLYIIRWITCIHLIHGSLYPLITFTHFSQRPWKQPMYSASTSSLLKVVVQSLSRIWLLWPHGQQHPRLPCPSPTPGAYSNSCPSIQWCHPTISSTVIPFSFHLQYFPASGSFQMSQFFTSDGQRFRGSASASVFPMNIQDWFPLGLTGWISLQSKGLSRVFSNTTVQKHQFFCSKLSL